MAKLMEGGWHVKLPSERTVQLIDWIDAPTVGIVWQCGYVGVSGALQRRRNDNASRLSLRQDWLLRYGEVVRT